MQGLAGPITVSVSDTLLSYVGVVGLWQPAPRVIHVQRGSRVFMTQVLWHEMFHAALWDAGMRLDSASEEQLADIVGAAVSASSYRLP